MDYVSIYKGNFGRFIIKADDVGLRSVSLSDEILEENFSPLVNEAKAQLHAYFDKKLTKFNLPIHFEESEASAFMISVWHALQSIPYGKTISYLDLARIVGTDKHTRAVGLANAKNPIPIIVPCHRVIGSDGSLTGFALGTQMKKKLLELEMPRHYGVQSDMFEGILS